MTRFRPTPADVTVTVLFALQGVGSEGSARGVVLAGLMVREGSAAWCSGLLLVVGVAVAAFWVRQWVSLLAEHLPLAGLWVMRCARVPVRIHNRIARAVLWAWEPAALTETAEVLHDSGAAALSVLMAIWLGEAAAFGWSLGAAHVVLSPLAFWVRERLRVRQR